MHEKRGQKQQILYKKYYTRKKGSEEKKRARAFFSHSRVGWSKTSEKKVFNIYTHTERELYCLSFEKRFPFRMKKLCEWLVPRTVRAIQLSTSNLVMYVGNEAGDLDSGRYSFFTILENKSFSACCALALSYANQLSETGDTLHLPFLHYPKSHFKLKTEARDLKIFTFCITKDFKSHGSCSCTKLCWSDH